MRVVYLTLATLFLGLITANAARAGGVIIDGRAPGAPLLPEVGSAGTPVISQEPGATEPRAPATPLVTDTTDQEIYLWAVMVFAGYDASAEPLDPEDTGAESPVTAVDEQGGCRTVPTSSMAVFGVLAVLFRRRRY